MAVTTTAKPLINAKYASTGAYEYTVGAATKTILDKFTLTNISSGAVVCSVYLVPSGENFGDSNRIIKDLSVAAAATEELSKLQNQILTTGDRIYVVAASASAVVQRVSGREVVTT